MAKDFVNPQVVESYDDHIRKLIPGYELVHQQVNAMLEGYLEDKMHPHLLVVGCGTGHELRALLEKHPCWRFTAIDPSATMLEKAKAAIAHLPAQKNVRFLQGDTSVLHDGMQFDAAVAILVAHFVPYSEKASFFQHIYTTLKHKGLLLTFDLTASTDKAQLRALQLLCQQQGLTEVQVCKMLERLKDDFSLLDPSQSIELLSQTGFVTVERYTQLLSYQGFIALKE